MGCPAPDSMPTMGSLQLKLREHHGSWELILAEPEDQDACSYIIFPRPGKEAVLMKSPQHDCLTKPA